MDEWTALQPVGFSATQPLDPSLLDQLVVNTQLDEWLNYKLYFVGSDQAMEKFRKYFGLCIDHIRNMHIVHVSIGTTIVDDYGFCYIDADCSGVDVVYVVANLQHCTKLSMISNFPDLENSIVKYVDATYIGEQNTRQVLGNRPIPSRTSDRVVWHNGYYISVYGSHSLNEVKMTQHGFPITEAEKNCELPSLPSHLIDGFDIKESLVALAQRSETLTYEQWKRTKEFIRKGLYGA